MEGSTCLNDTFDDKSNKEKKNIVILLKSEFSDAYINYY